MKKTVLLLMLILLPLISNADTVEIDGIYYNLIAKAKVAEVTRNPQGYEGDVVIPASVTYQGVKYDVTSIGAKAFYFCSITSVTIPCSVTSIGEDAFMGLKKELTFVKIEDLATWCNITFHLRCNPLSHTAHLYLNDEEINELVIPNSVTSISDYAFQGYYGLTSVIFHNNLEEIGNYAFSSCRNLESVSISNGLNVIKAGAFSQCGGLKEITIPNSVTQIRDSVFYLCHNLSSVLIQDGVSSMGSNVFQYCSALSSISLPNSLMSIGDYTFASCTSLSSISIPDNIKTIGKYALSGCSSLKTIILGKSISRIKSMAFSECKEIENVYCYSRNVPNTNLDVFKDSYIEYSTLHVPVSSISSYETKEPWKSFKEIIKIDIPTHKLTYMIDGIEFKSYEIEEDEEITPEPFPIKEGHTFSGWSEIPETMPAHDVIVTGTFNINKYNLIYKVDDEDYKTYEIEYGTPITPEAKPEKEGYTFYGWSDIPDTMPAHDVIVTGTFNINKYEFIYKVDNEDYKKYHIVYGTTITPEAEPEKEGYTFSGWSEIPETMPAHNVTVTGSFSINSYKLTYIIDNEIYKETTYEFGATITPEPEPEGNYTSFEWVGLPDTMPAHDVIVHANYEITGIINISDIEYSKCQFFSIDGKRIAKPQSGFNIMKKSDGSTRKVVIR